MDVLTKAGLELNPKEKMGDGSYSSALNRFNAQTQELKRLLREESDGDDEEETACDKKMS